MISVHFQGKPFNITVIQAYAPTSKSKEAEVEWFYEDLQDLLELIPPKDILFILGDWNIKVGSQEIPGVTSKFGLGVRNEAGQRLIEFFLFFFFFAYHWLKNPNIFLPLSGRPQEKNNNR